MIAEDRIQKKNNSGQFPAMVSTDALVEAQSSSITTLRTENGGGVTFPFGVDSDGIPKSIDGGGNTVGARWLMTATPAEIRGAIKQERGREHQQPGAKDEPDEPWYGSVDDKTLAQLDSSIKLFQEDRLGGLFDSTHARVA